MGIRFYCPNGHKLNVKSFLAGKRGVCPHCDARFRIPHESQIPGRANKSSAANSAAPRLRLPTPMVAAGTNASRATNHASAGPPVIVEEDQSLADAVLAEDAEEMQEAEGSGVAVGQQSSKSATASPPSPSRLAPIDEAPQAAWYVRPPAGGQYGPALSAVMRQWMEEGRVSADSLVWREGWSDWRPAHEVFVQFFAAPSGEGAGAPAAAAAIPPLGPSKSSTHPAARTGGVRNSRQRAAMIVTILGLVSLLLLAVLVYTIVQFS